MIWETEIYGSPFRGDKVTWIKSNQKDLNLNCNLDANAEMSQVDTSQTRRQITYLAKGD